MEGRGGGGGGVGETDRMLNRGRPVKCFHLYRFCGNSLLRFEQPCIEYT